MNSCKICKHWVYGHYTTGVGVCHAGITEGDSRFYADHNCSEGEVWFLTGPDFGCMHWTCNHVFDMAVCAFGVWYRKCSRCEHMEPVKDVAMA